MAYLYKKTIGGRPYYYLRISKKINNKLMVKDIAYLGTDLSKIKDKLEDLPAKYSKDIRKAYRNINKYIQSNFYVEKAQGLKIKSCDYLTREQLLQVEAAKLHFNQHFLKLDKAVIEETFKDFLIDFAFNTTSIEGNTITLAEADKLLRENLTPKNKTLREIYDLQNTEKVFFSILNSRDQISHDVITDLHDRLMENIDIRKGYRTHDVRVFKSRFDSTPFQYIKADMDILLNLIEEKSEMLHPLVLAGIFHQKFERIHPFSDGNGRTGRMLMNYLLMQKGYPPIIIRKARRGDYLDALANADTANLSSIDVERYRRLIGYLAEELIDSYWNNFNI